MRNTIALVVTLLALSLPGCGEKGGSGASGGGGGGGPVGTWVLDAAAVLKDALADAEAGMAKQMEQLPPEQREMMKKAMAEQDMAGRLKESLKALDGTLTIAADKTFSATMVAGGKERDTLAGTWTQSGESITLTPTTKNGKPATGSDAEPPLTLALRGGMLVSSDPEAGPRFTFRRK